LQSEFNEILEQLPINLTGKERQIIHTNFRDFQNPRKLNYMKLLNLCHPLNRSNKADDLEIKDISNLLRQKIRRRCEFIVPGELKRPYKHFCSKDTKLISLESFSIGVRDLGIKLNIEQERMLFNLINHNNGSKFINFVDFKVFVCDPFNIDIIWKFNRSKKRSGVSVKDLIASVTKQDTGSSSLITAQQFSRALENCGIDLSDSDINRFMMKFDPDELQRFNIKEFSKFLTGDEDVSIKPTKKDYSSDNDNVEGEIDESADWMALKRAIKKKMNSGYSLSEIFSIFDANNKKVLDLMSLQNGARELGIPLTRLEARAILRKLGLAAEGVVDKKSFLYAFGLIDKSDKPLTRRNKSYDMETENRSVQVFLDNISFYYLLLIYLYFVTFRHQRQY
jgi:Ca2+-binding EF-hand superfamily protein